VKHADSSYAPDLPLPSYILVVSFGLIRITPAHGPIEIAPGTHRMRREEAVRAVQSDNSRDSNSIPRALRQSLTPEQQGLMRFPIADFVRPSLSPAESGICGIQLSSAESEKG